MSVDRNDTSGHGRAMASYVLIPCKPLAEGKSRLAGVLTRAQRKDLCAEFLTRTLALAGALVPARRIAVVSADAEVDAIARANGAETIADGGHGFNAALSFARDLLVARNASPTRLLVLPIDLPVATAACVGALFDLDVDVAIAPDAAGSGTNLLCLGARALAGFEFRYGPGSLQAHCGQAAEKNWRLQIVTDPRLAFDIDGPQDYADWIRPGAGDAARRSDSIGEGSYGLV